MKTLSPPSLPRFSLPWWSVCARRGRSWPGSSRRPSSSGYPRLSTSVWRSSTWAGTSWRLWRPPFCPRPSSSWSQSACPGQTSLTTSSHDSSAKLCRRRPWANNKRLPWSTRSGDSLESLTLKAIFNKNYGDWGDPAGGAGVTLPGLPASLAGKHRGSTTEVGQTTVGWLLASCHSTPWPLQYSKLFMFNYIISPFLK